MLLGDAHGVVGHAELDGLAADLIAVDGLLGNLENGDVDLLHGGGQNVLGREAGLVLIDADDQLAGFLSGLDDAVASAAGGVEDDVAAVGVHLGSGGLALGGVAEALEVLDVDGDVLALGLVGVLDAGLIAPLELVDDDGLHAADEADLAGLGGHSGDVADQEGRLLGAEDDAGDVVRGVLVGVVDDSEVDVGVLLGRGLDSLGHGEADAPDQVVLAVDGLVQVGAVVGLLLGLGVGDLGAGLVLEFLQALPGKLVEGLVVDAAHVGDHGHLVGALGALVGAGGAGVGSAAATAAGQSQREDACGRHGGDALETLVHVSLPFH